MRSATARQDPDHWQSIEEEKCASAEPRQIRLPRRAKDLTRRAEILTRRGGNLYLVD